MSSKAVRKLEKGQIWRGHKGDARIEDIWRANPIEPYIIAKVSMQGYAFEQAIASSKFSQEYFSFVGNSEKPSVPKKKTRVKKLRG